MQKNFYRFSCGVSLFLFFFFSMYILFLPFIPLPLFRHQGLKGFSRLYLFSLINFFVCLHCALSLYIFCLVIVLLFVVAVVVILLVFFPLSLFFSKSFYSLFFSTLFFVFFLFNCFWLWYCCWCWVSKGYINRREVFLCYWELIGLLLQWDRSNESHLIWQQQQHWRIQTGPRCHHRVCLFIVFHPQAPEVHFWPEKREKKWIQNFIFFTLQYFGNRNESPSSLCHKIRHCSP